MVSGFGFWVSGFGFRVSGVGCRISGFGCRHLLDVAGDRDDALLRARRKVKLTKECC